MTYEEALLQVAAKDQPLATWLIHQHECVETVKADVKVMKADVCEIKTLIQRAYHVTIGALVLGLGTVVWEIIMHGGLR